MDAILPYLIWAVLILIVLSLVATLLFGLRALAYGKANTFTIGSFLVPVLTFGVLYLVMGDWIEAGVMTMVVMFVLTALVLLLSGVRGVFT